MYGWQISELVNQSIDGLTTRGKKGEKEGKKKGNTEGGRMETDEFMD